MRAPALTLALVLLAAAPALGARPFPGEDDAGTGGDAPTFFVEDELPVPVGVWHGNVTGTLDFADHYRVTLAEGAAMRFRVDSEGPLDVRLLGPDRLWYDTFVPGEEWRFVVPDGGDWYVGVFHDGALHSTTRVGYTVTLVPDAPPAHGLVAVARDGWRVLEIVWDAPTYVEFLLRAALVDEDRPGFALYEWAVPYEQDGRIYHAGSGQMVSRFGHSMEISSRPGLVPDFPVPRAAEEEGGAAGWIRGGGVIDGPSRILLVGSDANLSATFMLRSDGPFRLREAGGPGSELVVWSSFHDDGPRASVPAARVALAGETTLDVDRQFLGVYRAGPGGGEMQAPDGTVYAVGANQGRWLDDPALGTWTFRVGADGGAYPIDGRLHLGGVLFPELGLFPSQT